MIIVPYGHVPIVLQIQMHVYSTLHIDNYFHPLLLVHNMHVGVYFIDVDSVRMQYSNKTCIWNLQIKDALGQTECVNLADFVLCEEVSIWFNLLKLLGGSIWSFVLHHMWII